MKVDELQSSNRITCLTRINLVTLAQPTMASPTLPTVQPEYPPPPARRPASPSPEHSDPKADDDWLDQEPLISNSSTSKRKPPPSLSTNWRRVFVGLAVLVIGLVGLDLVRSLARAGPGQGQNRVIYTESVNQTALAKHYGYNPTEKVVVLYGKYTVWPHHVDLGVRAEG